MEKKRRDWSKRKYRNRALAMGITMILIGLSELPTIWTSKSNLTPITGTLSAADTYVSTVTYKGHESHKYELIFYLQGSKQKYYLAENIGNNDSDDKYENILQGLKRADKVSVWIKKSEVDSYEPKVFQIDNEKTTLLDFESVQLGNSPLTALLLLGGMGLLLMVLWGSYPDKFRKFTGFDD